MADVGRIDIKKLMSYGDDLVEVLKNKKDVNNLMQSLEGAKTLRTSCEADFHETTFDFGAIQFDKCFYAVEYQKKINACKQRIHAANTEVLSDKDLDSLENELEEELQKEEWALEMYGEVGFTLAYALPPFWYDGRLSSRLVDKAREGKMSEWGCSLVKKHTCERRLQSLEAQTLCEAEGEPQSRGFEA
ncbi:hypothetical protein IFM89_032189 [Coptis chinensis]|uniref:Uncharacterized protein n=1 Tax=Coptis chinensis TaxID=261450 RepID=A0A835IYY0_9MAGN|nr:hypothetical protein IFM89_032189 [Coptis chinensis]